MTQSVMMPLLPTQITVSSRLYPDSHPRTDGRKWNHLAGQAGRGQESPVRRPRLAGWACACVAWNFAKSGGTRNFHFKPPITLLNHGEMRPLNLGQSSFLDAHQDATPQSASFFNRPTEHLKDLRRGKNSTSLD